MFIWTIGDVAAVIIFVAIIVYIVYTLISGHIATKEMDQNNSIEYKKSAKAEAKPKEAKKEAPFWMCALVLAVMLAAIYAYCAWRGWLH